MGEIFKIRANSVVLLVDSGAVAKVLGHQRGNVFWIEILHPKNMAGKDFESIDNMKFLFQLFAGEKPEVNSIIEFLDQAKMAL